MGANRLVAPQAERSDGISSTTSALAVETQSADAHGEQRDPTAPRRVPSWPPSQEARRVTVPRRSPTTGAHATERPPRVGLSGDASPPARRSAAPRSARRATRSTDDPRRAAGAPISSEPARAVRRRRLPDGVAPLMTPARAGDARAARPDPRAIGQRGGSRRPRDGDPAVGPTAAPTRSSVWKRRKRPAIAGRERRREARLGGAPQQRAHPRRARARRARRAPSPLRRAAGGCPGSGSLRSSDTVARSSRSSLPQGAQASRCASMRERSSGPRSRSR